MRLHVRKLYYKRDDKKESPARYSAKQPRGVGTDVYATIKMMPILRKYKDLRKGILKHEVEEIKAWGKGSTRAHRIANGKEPAVTKRLGGERGFWREITRREKGK